MIRSFIFVFRAGFDARLGVFAGCLRFPTPRPSRADFFSCFSRGIAGVSLDAWEDAGEDAWEDAWEDACDFDSLIVDAAAAFSAGLSVSFAAGATLLSVVFALSAGFFSEAFSEAFPEAFSEAFSDSFFSASSVLRYDSLR